MDYQKIYNALIDTRKNRSLEDGKYYEHHHVIPKSKGGTNLDENIIALTPREHFLAHWLLWKIYRDRQTSYAFFSMCQYRKGDRKDLKISSRSYEEARISRLETGVSDETKKRMSEAKLGKKYTEEAKRNMSLGKKGSIPWNKGKKGILDSTSKKMSDKAQHRKRKNLEFFIKTIEYMDLYTPTQKKILEMYVDGKTNQEISEVLQIKDYEIKNSLRSISNKYRRTILSY